MAKRRSRGEGSVYLRGSTWWIQYRADSKVYNESARTDKKLDAIEYLKKKLGEIASGRRPSIEFEKTTFEDLTKAYLRNFEKEGKRDKKRAKVSLQHLGDTFKGCRAIDIKRQAIEEYGRKRINDGKVKPGTVNRELSVLQKMFTLGVIDEMVSPDRVPFIKMYPKAAPRQGFVRREQYEKLLSASPEWFRPVLTFAFHTGWRKEEILGLEWQWVDMKERQITLPGREAKNGLSRPIHADDVVYSILKRQREKRLEDGARTFEYVFYRMRSERGNRTERKEKLHPERIGNFGKVWVKICKAAGLEGLLFHDLRRSAVREMVRNGYRERVAMQVSGHKSREVFDRYDIVDLEDQRVAAERRIEKISNNYN